MDKIQVLTWHDKHGDYQYGPITSVTELGEAALNILQERLDQGYIFWPEDHEERARKILAAKDGDAAYQMLLDRNDHEYERISLQALR